MNWKVENLLIVLTISALLPIQSSIGSLLENEKLLELTEELSQLRTRVESLETEKEKMATHFGDLQTENWKLKSIVKELKVQVSTQDEQIAVLNSFVSNLEKYLPLKWALHEKMNSSSEASAASRNIPTTRALSNPPSSCQEWSDGSVLVMTDGIYLVKNIETSKIEAVFCQFSSGNPISQHFIGNVDVKTKSVHFYVTRNSTFSDSYSVIPFEIERLNVGGGMDVASGIFTAPVDGVYHFDFSAVKEVSVKHLEIFLTVNGAHYAFAYTGQTATGSLETVSLSASIRLKANDRVYMINNNGGILFDNYYHYTHFSGWLVDEIF